MVSVYEHYKISNNKLMSSNESSINFEAASVTRFVQNDKPFESQMPLKNVHTTLERQIK